MVDTVLAGRYRLETQVGAGGMGEVYRAVDEPTGRRVAVKVLKAKARDVDRSRFKREIRTLAELQHPGLVNYVDHGTTPDQRLFLVMEWLQGEDLAMLLARGQVGLSDAVEIVRRAAQAMAAVHARGIVHRDLKPSNIFIVRTGQHHGVKLIDFGMVKIPEPDDYDTVHGTFIGTPWFIAPEQARGHPVDARADVYSLGAVLFRLVAGRNAFESRHLIAYLGRLVLEEAPRTRTIRPDVPAELDDLLAACLRRDRAERPEDAGELSRRLARLPKLDNRLPRALQSTAQPSVERTFDAMVRDQMTYAPPPSGEPTLLGAQESRVVAVLVAQLSADTLAAESARRLLTILGNRARYEPLRRGQLVAALGLDRTVGDEAIRAARGALFLMRAAPGARIAVATGRAVAGRDGLAGEALERGAQLLEALQTPGIRMDQVTQPLLDGHFSVRDDSQGALLLSEDAADAEPRPLLGKTMPIVGRMMEIERLVAMFDQVVTDGQPGALVVTGAAGVGKSRVRKEVVRKLREEMPAVEVLLARGEPMLAHCGISDIGRALRTLIGIRDEQPRETKALKLVRYLSRFPELPEYTVDFLGEFVGAAPFEDSQAVQTARSAPQLMSARVFCAVESLWRLESKRAPRLLVLEDFDDLDDSSVALVEWLLACKDLPLAVFAFGRTGGAARFPKLWEGRRVEHIPLGPLPQAACIHIAREAAPSLDSALVDRIMDRAQGNPLFLEELLRHATHDGGELPLSVQALIQNQLDKLSSGPRQVARAASVFGEEFWTDALRALVGADCEQHIESLVREEILVRSPVSRLPDQTQWSFRRAMVCETAYASLLEPDRAELHRKAAAWLLSVGELEFATLARHAEAGPDHSHAVELYARAYSQAYSKGQLETSLTFAKRAGACTDDPLLRAQSLLQQAQVLSWMGKLGEQLDAALAAATLGATGTDLWGEARRVAGMAQRERGRNAEADALFSETLHHPQSVHLSAGTRSRLFSEWARTLVELGRSRDGFALAERAVADAEQAGRQEANAMLRALDARALVLGYLGDFSAAVDATAEVVEHADRIGDLLQATHTRINLGFSLTRVGIVDQGKAVLDRALADAKSLGVPAGEGLAMHNLGLIYARRGDLDRAIALQYEASRLGERIGHYRLMLLGHIYEATFLSWRRQGDDVARAQRLVKLARSRAPALPFTEVDAILAHAQVDWASGDLHAALARCTDALDRARSLGGMEAGEEGLHLTRVLLLLELARDEEADAAVHDAYACVCSRAGKMGKREHRDAYLSQLHECRRIVDIASERLSLTRPRVTGCPPKT
ncbi:MAG: protein kinase [Polyangiaceae bacterium]|nr:protein kinase [Polyangiaceae bacterium]